MHDIRFIRENPEAFDRGLARRGLEPQAQRLIALDEKRRTAIQAAEAAQARRNAASKEIGEAKKAKDEEKAKGLLAEVAALKESIPAMEAAEKKATEELNAALAEIPNLPLDEVPDGKDSNDNVEHHRFGAKRDYAFTPKQHFELGEALGANGFRGGGQVVRRALCCSEKGARAARACARAIHARCAHQRAAQLHRSLATAAGARRGDVWYGAVAEICRRSIFAIRQCCRSGDIASESRNALGAFRTEFVKQINEELIWLQIFPSYRMREHLAKDASLSYPRCTTIIGDNDVTGQVAKWMLYG